MLVIAHRIDNGIHAVVLPVQGIHVRSRMKLLGLKNMSPKDILLNILSINGDLICFTALYYYCSIVVCKRDLRSRVKLAAFLFIRARRFPYAPGREKFCRYSFAPPAFSLPAPIPQTGYECVRTISSYGLPPDWK